MLRVMLVWACVVGAVSCAAGCCGSMHRRSAENVSGEMSAGTEEFLEVLREFRGQEGRWPADADELVAFAHAGGRGGWRVPARSISFDVRDEALLVTVRRGRRAPRAEDRIALRAENGGVVLVPARVIEWEDSRRSIVE